jgi:hypothetical protein
VAWFGFSWFELEEGMMGVLAGCEELIVPVRNAWDEEIEIRRENSSLQIIPQLSKPQISSAYILDQTSEA